MLASFIECSTTSIAGTAGNGAVTCQRLSGFPYFPDLWGTTSAAMDVDYVMEDVLTNPAVPLFERGYGSVTGTGSLASAILARTTPYETWNGTSWVESGATALAFGATPIIGNVRIRIAPTADNFLPPPPAMWTGGGGTFAGWAPTGNLQGSPSTTGPGLTMATGLEFYVPYLNVIRGAISGFGVYLASAGTAGNGIRAALYGVGPDGLPGNCITQFNQLLVTSSGFIQDTTPSTWGVRANPIRLRPAWFYIGFKSNDAAAVIACTSRAAMIGANPLGQLDDFGWGGIIQKTAEVAFPYPAMPTGRPVNTGYVNALAQQLSVPSLFLRIGN